MKIRRYILFLLLCASPVAYVSAQLPGAFDRGAVGVSGGTMLFYGDLAGYKVLPKFRHFPNTFETGYRVFVKRKVIGGLGGRLGFEKGSLQGGHRNGRGAQHLSFRTDLMNFNLSANYEVTRILSNVTEETDRRFYADINVGIGMLLFRSYSVRSELGGVYDFYGYSQADISEGESQKILLNREKPLMRMSIPVGVDIGYRLNHNTDINFNVTLFNSTTDKLDTFVRDWTARDKFAYFGLGLTYNFNRSKDDLPEKEEEEEEESASVEEGDDVDLSEIDLSEASGEKKGLFSNMFGGGGQDDEDLLRIKLKLFQIQLKLFQMQYLLGQQED